MSETNQTDDRVEIVVKKARRFRIDWVVVALGAAAATLFVANKLQSEETDEVVVENVDA